MWLKNCEWEKKKKWIQLNWIIILINTLVKIKSRSCEITRESSSNEEEKKKNTVIIENMNELVVEIKVFEKKMNEEVEEWSEWE